jgi:hypothetical protein
VKSARDYPKLLIQSRTWVVDSTPCYIDLGFTVFGSDRLFKNNDNRVKNGVKYRVKYRAKNMGKRCLTDKILNYRTKPNTR